jgi:hypothetical protein
MFLVLSEKPVADICSVSNERNTIACLVDHEDSKDICLQLTKDGNNRLWGLELGQPLEVLQLEEECAGRNRARR